jgi:threonine aldolase
MTIDLRSDTVTLPTPAMREAMAAAPLGDDVYGEDPTVNALEAEAAALLGHEAGLFVASGTMGNLTSVLTHCGRGDEMILGKQTHIFRYEVASAAAYGGVQPNTLDVQRDGTLDLDAVRDAVRSPNLHFPVSRLICIENTNAGALGAPTPPEYTDAVVALAREHEMKVHVDGARLFNAAAALGVPARELVRGVDSVSVCLSKGLCAPVGSVVVGSRAFIERARRTRKSLGGGMRQAGVIAAAGLVALREMPARLSEDHRRARLLAEGLAAIPYIQIELDRVKSNMLFFDVAPDSPVPAAELSARLKAEHGILMNPYSEKRMRAVLHHWISDDDVQRTLAAVRAILVPAAERLSAD